MTDGFSIINAIAVFSFVIVCCCFAGKVLHVVPFLFTSFSQLTFADHSFNFSSVIPFFYNREIQILHHCF